MCYIFVLFHILVFIETYFLYKKKLRKKSILLGILNTILFLINIIKLLPTFDVTYSSIHYFQEELVNNTILNLLWVILNLLFMSLVFFILNKNNKFKKQNLLIKYVINSFLVILAIFYIIVIFSKSSAFILFLFLIYSISSLIRNYIKTKKNYVLITALLLCIVVFYSYFTYTGAARFQIALLGYPKEAYETGLEEQKYFEEKNIKKYYPILEVPLKDGQIGLIEVKNYMFIKIGKIMKF